MRNIKLLLEYDGTDFFGWQRQASERTVQEEIEKVLTQVLQSPISIIGAGRTDTGVHARGQVAHFTSTTQLPEEKILYALNGLLPGDIAIHSVEDVPPEFHSRFSAREREYSYTISTTPTALGRKFCWEYGVALHVGLMNECAALLLGEHDFTSFCKLEKEVDNKLCTIYDAEWERKERILQFHIRGNRFLHGMVRSIVGTLVDVGRGFITRADFETILAAKNRSEASQSVPAKGLCLERVGY